MVAMLIGLGVVSIIASTVSVVVSMRPKRRRKPQRVKMLRNVLDDGVSEFQDAVDALQRGEVQDEDMENLLGSSMHGVRTPPTELYTSRVFARADGPHFVIDIEDTRDYPVVSVELIRAVLPSGSYTIENGYNDAVAVSMQAGDFITVTVPEGVYNVSTLAATLQSALCAVECGFTVSINPLNHRCTVSHAKQFSLSFPPTGSLAYELGFDTGVIESTKHSGCEYTLTGPHRVDIGAPRYVYLVSEELDGDGMHESGILAEIPIVAALQFTDYAAHAARRRKFARAIRLRQLTCSLMKPATRRPASSDVARVSRRDLVPFQLHGIVATFTLELTRVRPLHHKVHSVSSLTDAVKSTDI